MSNHNIQIGPKGHSPHRPTEMFTFFGGLRYLGVGALAHAALIGPVFNPHSLWSWGYVAAWPIPLIGFVLGWIGFVLAYVLAAALVIGLAWFAIWLCLEVRDQLRVMRRQAAEARERGELG